MKRTPHYLLLLILIGVISACSKHAVAPAEDTSVIPQGYFVGPFTLIHKSSATGKLDTSSAVVTITFTLATASYVVGGDTSKIQAPSKGSFTADGTILNFTDNTFNKTTNANAAKKHLNGPYLYTYDGTLLHIYGSSDTLSYNYNLQIH